MPHVNEKQRDRGAQGKHSHGELLTLESVWEVQSHLISSPNLTTITGHINTQRGQEAD